MAYVDVLKYLKFDELTDQQRARLKARFLRRKKGLQAALKTVDEGLKALAKKPKAKKAAKRKAARRRTRR